MVPGAFLCYYCSMTNTTGIHATLTRYLDDTLVKVSKSPKPSRSVQSAQARAAERLTLIAAELIWEGTDVSFTDDADGTATLAWVTFENEAARIVAHASN